MSRIIPPKNLNIKWLRTFVAIVEGGTYEKASQTCNRTKASIYHHINCLEEVVGVTLIDRSGHKRFPTKEGKVFYNYALEFIKLNDDIILRMK